MANEYGVSTKSVSRDIAEIKNFLCESRDLVGNTELKYASNAISLAEAIAPCVLWIDELEKAFAGLNSINSSEVTVRLLGNVLTWMQEKDGPTFVVATANDISKLPPELLRKGRFDEIFYVGLPSEAKRKAIFEIHIKKKRPMDLDAIDIDKLVKKSEGYSGSDIEGVVREGVELAFVKMKNALTTEDIITVMDDTQPISRTKVHRPVFSRMLLLLQLRM